MADPRDSVVWQGESSGGFGAPAETGGREGFLRLWFECSGGYARAVKTKDGTAYVGRCPKCGASATFPIGQGGTSVRAFRVSCRP